MRTVVVYESQFGNTHEVAAAIAAEAGEHGPVDLVAVPRATADLLLGADLVFVGGPTHAHGLSRVSSREAATADAEKHPDLHLDPDHEGPGVREWFEGLGQVPGTRAAAFDTRVHAPAPLTGRASKGISRRLFQHGFTEVLDPESFLVDTHNHLLAGETDRARRWAAEAIAAVR